MLQQAARQRTDLHNLYRIRDVSASQNLQDVAVIGINVGNEHAPEHALNLGALSKNSNPDMLIQSHADLCGLVSFML